MQRRQATGAQGLVRAGVVPTTPGLSKESGERWAIFWLCCADQAIFVRFLFEVCWLLSFFSPAVPVQGSAAIWF